MAPATVGSKLFYYLAVRNVLSGISLLRCRIARTGGTPDASRSRWQGWWSRPSLNYFKACSYNGDSLGACSYILVSLGKLKVVRTLSILLGQRMSLHGRFRTLSSYCDLCEVEREEHHEFNEYERVVYIF